MAEEFFIPKLGQTVEEVTLVRWLVEDGAKVDRGQELMEVETDKAVFPVESAARGILHRGPYNDGDVVPVLTVVAVIGKPDDKFEVKGPAATPAGASAPAEAMLVSGSRPAQMSAMATITVELYPREPETDEPAPSDTFDPLRTLRRVQLYLAGLFSVCR